MNMSKDTEIQWIALAIVILSVMTAFGALIIGRNDEAIKQPVVLAMVSLVSGLLGLGGGILTSGNKKGDNAPNAQGPVTINTASAEPGVTPASNPPNIGGGVA